MKKILLYLSHKSLYRIYKLLLIVAYFSVVAQNTFAQSPLCASSPTVFGYEYVSSVSINGQVRQGNTGYSGPGYMDFSGSSITNLVAGNTYPVSVTVVTNNTWHEYVKIWFDFNGNQNLQDPGELIFDQNNSWNGTYTFSGNIIVPTNAFNGNVFLRVIMVYADVPQLCGNYSFGNTMDFKATISGGVTPRTLTVACAGTPGFIGNVVSTPAGINTASGFNSANFSDGSTVTLTASNVSGGTFVNWTGDATGTNTSIALNMNANKSVTANFAANIPANPTSISTSANPICIGTATQLTANGTQGTVYWYSGSCGGTSIGTGNSIIVSPGVTTNYFAKNFNNGLFSNSCASTTITVNTAPVISCPSNITVNNTPGLCGANVSYPAATATGSPTPTITYSHASGSFFPSGTTTVTATATNSCGSTSCTFIVKVIDIQAPVISCPFNITVNATPGVCGAVVNYSSPAATDNCGSNNLPTSISGYAFKGNYNGHTYFMSNSMATPETAHANAIALGGHLVTINSAAENAFVSAMSPNYMWIGYTDRDVEGTFRWITDEPVTYTNWAPGEPNNAGGNEDWAVINWGSDKWNDWYYTASAYYVVEFSGGSVPTTLLTGLGSGATFPIGTSTVTWQATDQSGNVSTCSFTVTVIDNIAPTVVAQNITLQLDQNGAVNITAAQVNNGSSDNCSITSLVLDKTSLNCSNLGANTVILTATDAGGNSNSATAVVTVQDNIAPSIVCPAPVTAYNTQIREETRVMNIPAGGSTNGWSPWVYNFTDPLPIGAKITGIDLTFTAVDQGWGGTGDYANLYVADTWIGNGQLLHSSTTHTTHFSGQIPAYNYGGNNTFKLNFTGYPGWVGFWQGGQMTIHYTTYDGCLALVALTSPTATDNCTTVTLTNSQNGTSNASDWYPVGTTNVVWTAKDASGNSSTCTQAITIVDNIAPVVITKNITIQLDATGAAAITAADVNNGSSDACGIATMILNKTAFNCSNVGANTVTLTVTDIHGNVASGTSTVTVEDHVAPVAIAQNITVQLNAAGTAAITAADVNNGSSDACGIASLVLDKLNFDCSNAGANTVTLTVTDIHGNVSSATAVVTVEDHVAPVAITQNITIQLDASGQASITPVQIDNGSTDACGIASLVLDKLNFDCSNAGANTVTLTVTDIHGNVSSATAVVTVEDHVVPVAITQNIIIQLDASGQASITPVQIDNGSSDACGIASLVLDKLNFDCSNVGANTVTLTVTDIHGNVTTATATVTVQDNIAPGLTVPVNIIRLNDAGVCGAVVNIGQAVATDNCSVASVNSNAPAFFPVGITTVTWTAIDVNGNTTTGTQTVEITNNAPVISGLTVSTPVQLGVATVASATHADNNLVAATWNWGDGSSTASVIAGTNISGSHVYSQTGLYNVTLTIEDACGKTDTEVFSYVVIYNPCNGFITGGGLISTTSGTYTANPTLTEKSEFEFEAKYKKGDVDPSGEFQFEMHSANFKVKSTSLDWLMVNNDQAILKGLATVNGHTGYHFIASIIDGNIVVKNGTDYLRLIVWDNAGNVLYDNQNGDLDNTRASNPINKGQIVIHKSKKGNCCEYDEEDDEKVSENSSDKDKKSGDISIVLPPVQIEMTVFPNPVVDAEVNISITNFGNTIAKVDLTSLTGQLVFSTPGVKFINGKAKIEFKQAKLKSGNYLLRVSEIGTSRVAVKQIIVSNNR